MRLLYGGVEPNPEAIAAARPDVIVGSADDGLGSVAAQVYGAISEIAAATLFDFGGRPRAFVSPELLRDLEERFA